MFKIFTEEIFEIEWINYGIARDVQDYWIRNFRRLIYTKYTKFNK